MAPGMFLLPFTFGAPLLVILGFFDHQSSFIRAALITLLAASIFAGVVASVLVILSRENYIAANKSLKIKVQTGLALGIVGGFSGLIWLAEFIMHQETRRPWSDVESWTLFFGPSIALMTYQLFALRRPVRSVREATTSPASERG
jgi:hypothetical protein